MADITYNVRTVYDTDTRGGVGNLNALGAAAGGASAQLGGLGNMGMWSMLRMAAGTAVVTGAIAALSYGVATLNGDVDSMVVSLAGLSAAAGVERSTGGLASWAENAEFAQATMAQIRRDAAALPGEAEDFLEVFNLGFAPALESGMAAADIASFTNRFAAVGISFRVDREQIGRDLGLMLQGRAGMHVNMWNKLKSVIGMTAEQFNQLGSAQRAALLDSALGNYQEMIDHYADTWAAVKSTTMSYAKETLRVFTRPLFDAMKGQLSQLNTAWADAESRINALAYGLGTVLAHAFDAAAGSARRMFSRIDAWTHGPSFWRLLRAGEGLWSHVSHAAGAVMDKGMAHPGASAAVGAGAMFGPATGLAVAVLSDFATHTLAVTSVMGSLGSILDSVVSVYGTVIDVVSAAGATLGGMLAEFLPRYMGMVATVWAAVSEALASYGQSLVNLFEAVRPAMSLMGAVLGWVSNLLGRMFGGAISDAITFVGGLIDTIASIIKWVSEKLSLPDLAQEVGTWEGPGTEVGQRFDRNYDIDKFMARLSRPFTEGQGSADLGYASKLHGGGEREVGQHGRPVVNVTINQTVNANESPDRILLLTRRGVQEGINHPLETPTTRVLH